MSLEDFIKVDRIIPQLPPKGEKLRLIIDTDFANEIDDMYAAALALVTPERFEIEGFIMTHFNNSWKGPESIDRSYGLFKEFMEASGLWGKYRVEKSADPISYYGYPSQGPGVDFIIERAHAGSEENPLWVVGLAAATNLASAILKDPSIIPKVRYVFHARSEYTWPQRSKQFNVLGDVHAARTLLKEWVPLVWFDSGTHIKLSMELDAKHIATTGAMGNFMYEYRKIIPWEACRTLNKGFYDLADISWMIDPEIGKSEIVHAPTMDPYMFFEQDQPNGKMLRVFDVDNDATWNMLFKNLKDNYKKIGGI